jgi:hypothetical protein
MGLDGSGDEGQDVAALQAACLDKAAVGGA